MVTLRAMVFVLSLLLVWDGATAQSADKGEKPKATIEATKPGPRCEWSPKEVIKPSPQCGHYSTMAQKPGTYDCGVKRNGDRCVEHCVFKGCAKGP